MILDGQYRDMCKRIGPNTQDVVINHLINTEKLTIDSQVINLMKQCDGGRLFVPFKTAGQMDMDLPIIYLDQLLPIVLSLGTLSPLQFYSTNSRKRQETNGTPT
jgi:hypothetical protein